METTDREATPGEPAPAANEPHAPMPSVRRAGGWPIRALLILLVSAVAIVPCLWLPRIEAGDLGSHTYNAWLVSLVQQGKAPGLWIASQHNNVFFDLLTVRLGTMVGFAAAEKIATSLAVCIFLWGAFALTSSVSRRPAWFLLPLLTMLAYGWTFHMGFLNFYISMGLAFGALAILWNARGLQCLYVLPFLPLIWSAHPLGLAWFLAAGVYILTARSLAPRVQWLLCAAVLACLLPIRLLLARRYEVRWWPRGIYDLNGSDQLILGEHYPLLSALLLLAVVACVIVHFVQTRREGWAPERFFPPALQLYALMLLGLRFLPNSILLPQYDGAVSYIAERFTLAVAILGCCVLAGLKPRVVFGLICGFIAVLYFTMVYQSAAKTYALERQVDALVQMVPENARVLATIFPFKDSRVFNHHVADRACIGRCFNIGNYEAATRQFRLRAGPGNRFVTPSIAESNQIMLGIYSVRPEDLPLWQFFQCGPTEVDMCLRPVHAGSLEQFSPAEAVRARK